MRNTPKPQQIYKHFKGNLYRIVTLAEDTETGETLVIYEALYGDFRIYARELGMFLEPVDRQKYPLFEYPEYSQQYRFEEAEKTLEQPEGVKTISPGQKETQSLSQEETQGSSKEETQSLSQEKTQKFVKNEAVGDEAIENEAGENAVDPLIYEFLDADTYQQRLNILAAVQHRITDDMINTMAVSMDVEIEDGDIAERYEQLKNCIMTMDRYEHSRP